MESSPPPRSSARPLRLLSQQRSSQHGPSDGTHGLRDYRDDARVERVWRRLEGRKLDSLGQGSSGQSRWAMALVAGVSLGLGFGSGRLSVDLPSLGDLTEKKFAASALPPAESAHHEQPLRSVGLDAAAATETVRAREVLVASVPRARPVSARRLEAVPVGVVSPGVVSPGVVSPGVVSPGVEAIVPVALPSEHTVLAGSWIELAERGAYAQAFQVLDERGELSALVAHGSPEELMTLADVARFAGRNAWAIQALREVTTRHEADENAPIAAMMLGNLLSRAGDAEGAARAYALNRRLSPEGDFAEDALIREFGVAVKAGERERAEDLLGEYNRKFPGSVRLLELQQALAGLASSEPSAESEDPEVDLPDPDGDLDAAPQ